MLRTTTGRISKLTIAALVVLGIAVFSTAQNTNLQQEKAVSTLCKEFRKIRDLIPTELLAQITTEHYRYDVKFRHAMKFLRSREFAIAADAFEESNLYQNILSQFRKVGIKTTDIASLGKIMNCLLTPPLEFGNGKIDELRKTGENNFVASEVTEFEASGDNETQGMQATEKVADKNEPELLIPLRFVLHLEDIRVGNAEPKDNIPVQQTTKKKMTDKKEKVEKRDEKTATAVDEKKIEKISTTLLEPENNNKMIENDDHKTDKKREEKVVVADAVTKLAQSETKLETNNEDFYNYDFGAMDEYEDEDYGDSFELDPDVPIGLDFGMAARSRGGATMRPFYADVMQAIPRKRFRNLLAKDLARNPELVKFYKLMRSTAFRRKVKRGLRSKRLKKPLAVMKRNFVDIPRLVTAVFKVFSWGPRRMKVDMVKNKKSI